MKSKARYISRIFVFLFALMLVTSFSTGRITHAAGLYQGVKTIYSLVTTDTNDIRTTLENATTHLTTETGAQLLCNMTMDMCTTCMSNATGIPIDLAPGAVPPDDSYCAGFETAYSPFNRTAQRPVDTRVSASMAGVALALEDITKNEPLPVNLAYYFKREAQDIPLVNKTAFAQELGGDMILSTFYDIWVVIRNLSYGIMAVFMLIVGVMIMLRHQVGARTVVTIQYALPRIVIALILTTISYPIVALAVSLLVPLSAILGSLIPRTSDYPLVTNLFRLGFVAMLNTPGAGIAVVLMTVIVCIVLVVFLLKLFLTLIGSYIKILVSAFTGPLVFAWSAIPGNESVVTDWFKKLAVHIAAVPAMFFGLRLADFFTDSIVDSIAGTPGVGFGGILTNVSTQQAQSGSGLLAFTAPVLILMLLVQLGKLPKTLETMVFGKKR